MPRRIPVHRPAASSGDSAIKVAACNGYENTDSRMADRRFYASKRWMAVRDLVLASEPLCRVCRSEGRITAANQVHHILERKDRPDLAVDTANLEPLCLPCHNGKRKR
jgi:5-methylcytosine-specific restriction protein A